MAKAFQKPVAQAYLIKAGFTDQTIKALYALPFKATKTMKLSMFQFKINHNIRYTRENLFKAKITDSDQYQLCGEKQTLEHLFVECQQVDSFWNTFSSCFLLSSICAK